MFYHSNRNRGLTLVGLVLTMLMVFAFASVVFAQDDNIEIVGTIEALGASTITVNGQVIDIAAAEINGPIEVGGAVKIEGTLTADGQIIAREVGTPDDDVLPGESELEGVVESFDGTTLVVNGQTIDVSGAEFDGDIMVGDVVKVHATATGPGQWVAREVGAVDDAMGDNTETSGSDDDGEFRITGTLEEIGDGFIVVSGQMISLDGADIRDNLVVGAQVEVRIVTDENGDLTATRVKNDSSGLGSGDDDSSGSGVDDLGILPVNDNEASVDDNFNDNDNANDNEASVDDNFNDNDNANDNEASIDDNDNQAPAPGGCTVNPPAGWVTYTVQSGDTLSGIASRSGSSVGELVNVNCIANPSFISTGTTLWVPTNPGPPARPPRDDNDNEASFNNNDNDGSFNNNDNEASFNNNDNSDDSSGSNSGPGGGDDDHGDDDGSGGNSGRGGGDDDDSSGSNSGHGGGDDHNDDD